MTPAKAMTQTCASNITLWPMMACSDASGGAL
jgi:hypothetical protein